MHGCLWWGLVSHHYNSLFGNFFKKKVQYYSDLLWIKLEKVDKYNPATAVFAEEPFQRSNYSRDGKKKDIFVDYIGKSCFKLHMFTCDLGFYTWMDTHQLTGENLHSSAQSWNLYWMEIIWIRESGGSRLLVSHNKTAKLYGRVTHIKFSTSSDFWARVGSSAYRWSSPWSLRAPLQASPWSPSGVSLGAPLLQTATHPHGHHLRVTVVVLHHEGMVLKQPNKQRNNQYFIGGFMCLFAAVESSDVWPSGWKIRLKRRKSRRNELS